MIRSRKTYIFTPDDEPDNELAIILRGSLLTESATEEWTENTVTQAYLGRAYAGHRDGGGRYITLTATVLTRHTTMAAAELEAHRRQLYLNTHPNGVMRCLFAYTGDTPGAVAVYRATLVHANPVPANAEQNNLGTITEPEHAELTDVLTEEALSSSGTAWLAMEYSFIMTPQEVPANDTEEADHE